MNELEPNNGDSALTEYVTVEEAAKILRVTSRTIRNWIAAKSLKSVRAGRRVLIRRAEIDRFPKRR